jgi:hypothetical protein
MSQSEPVGYGVLVRHPGFVDRILPAEGNTYYPIDDVNHWLSAGREPMCLCTEEDARTLAEDLTAKFGGQRYRFTVAACRLVPRWFILHPQNARENAVIGNREQIL